MHEVYDFFHIGGVVLFFGGIIASLALLFYAERKARADALRAGAKRAHQMNILTTVPGVVMIILSGMLQMSYTKGISSESWLAVGLVLFLLAVIILFAFFIPAHKKLIRAVGGADASVPDDLFTTLHRIYFWGVVMLVLPIGTMLLSIFKPHMW